MKGKETEKSGEVLDGKTNEAEKRRRGHLPGKMFGRPVTANFPLKVLLYECFVQMSIPLRSSRQRRK